MTAPSAAVTCPWCGKYHPTRPARGHCDDCGGPLPAPFGAERPAAPPAPPRTLPAPYRRRILISTNGLAITGFVFLAVGLPFLVVSGILAGAQGPTTSVLITVFAPLGLLFGIAGGLLFKSGLGRGRKKLLALEQGTAAEGEVVSVELDTNVRINGRSPWAIEYTFRAPSGKVTGTCRSWSRTDADRRPGDPLWVVYLAADPQTNTIWPPVR